MGSSSLVSLILSPIKNVFNYHKKKLLFFILSLLILLVVLFPFSDLTIFSQQKINELLSRSGSRVSYSNINFNFLPFGIRTTDFSFSSPSIKQEININSVVARPNLLSFLKMQPGGSIILNDFLGGDIQINASLAGKTEENTRLFNLEAELFKVSVLELLKAAGQNFPIKGDAFGDLFVKIEESFRQQPEGEFKLNLKNVEVPKELSLPMFNLEFPEKILWSNTNISGEFKSGRIDIKESTIGTKSAPINGRIKGYVSCPATKSPMGVKLACATYDIKVELELNREFRQSLESVLGFVLTSDKANIKSLPGGGISYLFSVQGNAQQRYAPPRVFKLSNF